MALIGAAGILSIALGQFGSFPPIPVYYFYPLFSDATSPPNLFQLFLLQWQEAENARAQEMKYQD
ncbi:hypothetical protein M378DRAFT_159988 [Amanita muscaria Koide BX008]|uniref:Uncharacterized protein n=1 Tax=Amanita muscaria (strain Koide BX008) TaxID=946122 RepID=A0A0C2SUG9_AMAMK|nr:hypothetical protein M378DRAFT_159988 [Amanita muscaria Koide BX008]